MENKDKPAYPVGIKNNTDYTIVEGMTKREVFAMATMQGLCANPAHTGDNQLGAKTIAEWSIAQADELLKQLDQNS